MAHKSFGQKKGLKEAKAKEPISFDIGDEKDINCRRTINGKLLIDLIAKVDSESMSDQASGIIGVFDIAVVPNDQERLHSVLDDPDVELGIEELSELCGWIVEQYTTRPTQSAANSQDGSASTRLTPEGERRLPENGSARKRPATSST